jgi:hypothetical protein
LYAPKVSYTIYLCPDDRRLAFTQKTIEKIGEDRWGFQLGMCTSCKDINKNVF